MTADPTSIEPPVERPPARWRTLCRRHLDAFVSLLACAVWTAPIAYRPGGGIADWSKELYYFAHARFALQQAKLPGPFSALPATLEAAHYPALNATRSYWANPEVMTISPFLPLLRVMAVVPFLKLLFVSHAAVGCLGTIALGRRLGLSLPFRVVLVVLTALNPWSAQHFAIGYTPHLAAFFAPWIAFFLLDPARRAWSAAVAGLLAAAMLYEGGFHVFVWTLLSVAIVLVASLFAGGVGARSRRACAHALGFFGTTLVLAGPKLHAIAGAYDGFRRAVPAGVGGLDAFFGLLTDATPIESFAPRHGTFFWDASVFMGWWFVLLAAALFLSAFTRARATWGQDELPPLVRRQLVAFAAAITWLACGWGTNWSDLAALVPPLDAEVYPYRFVFLALLFAIVVLVLEADALFREARALRRTRRWLVPLAFAPVVFFGFRRYREHAVLATSVDVLPQVRGYYAHLRATSPSAGPAKPRSTP